MKNPLVSIIIPSYNSEAYITKALDSLLDQTYKNIQVIIVDDGSYDKSPNIIKSYRNKFESKGMDFVYIYQENSGVGTAMNNGLKHINGEYFIWQDSDDYLEKDAVYNLLVNISSKKLDIVRGASRHIYKTGKIEEKHSKHPNAKNIFKNYITGEDAFQFSGVFIVRTKYFDSVVKNREIYKSKYGQNWQLILPVAYKGKYGYLDKVVLNYVVRDGSLSRSAKDIKEKILENKNRENILLEVLKNINFKCVFEKWKWILYVKTKYFKMNTSLSFAKVLKRK